MDKEELQEYIDYSHLGCYNFEIDKLTTTQYTTGYAHDEKGYYTYKVDERQNIHKHYMSSEQDCIDKLFKTLKNTLINLNQSLPDLDNVKDNHSDSNKSEEYFVNLFNNRKSEIEDYIYSEFTEYKNKFNISDLGNLHINMETECIFFENPIPDTDQFITIEFDIETEELSYITIDG